MAGRSLTLDSATAWIFDLDNTLYSPETRLFDQVERRMGRFIEEHLGLAPDAARRLQKQGFRDHGSTMRCLMIEHGVAPQVFLEYVHSIDYGVLSADAALDAALAALPGRRLVFTNGSTAHALRVLARLGVTARFDAIFDIAAADWQPKPQPATYARLVAAHGIDPRNAVMIEDIAGNLRPAAALGMTTVWLRNSHDWARAGANGDHIDHVVDDLVAWMSEVAQATGARAPRR
jgi:putative hydrolase of the HAD superfamily